MFEDLKQKTFKKAIPLSIILIIIGLVMMGFFAKNTFYAIFGYADFEQLEPDKIKNQLVEFDMTANFGCYLEEYEYNSETRYRKTTYLYYVIWTGDENATDYRYMTVKVPASWEKEMEAMADMSAQQYYSDPIHVVGSIKKLDDEEYGYFKDYFEEAGWTAQDIEEGTLPYYINIYTSKASMDGITLLVFFAGLALVIWGIVRIVKGANGGYLKKFNEDIAKAGYTESAIASDYNSATEMTKNGGIKVGRLMIYYTSGAQVRALPANKIMWAYQNTTTHRTNGIKTGTTYSVMIYSEDNKNATTLSVPNEATAQDMLKRMFAIFPWVVVGYSDDIKRQFFKNREEFKQLRYNTCEHVAVEPGFENYGGEQ